MLESKLVDECRKLTKAAGGELDRTVNPARRGVQDHLLLLPGGIIVFVEFKQLQHVHRKNPPQSRREKTLQRLGMYYVKVGSVEQFKTLLANLQEDPKC